MIDHEAILRKTAEEIRAANINGWGNACEGGADRIASLEARCRVLTEAATKVHGIIAEYWGPCMGSVECLLTLREAVGEEAKSWGPKVSDLPRVTSLETACQHDCVQNGYPDQDCPKHGSSTGTAPSGEKHQDKPRPVTQYDGSLKDGDTIMDRKGNLWVARAPAETKGDASA